MPTEQQIATALFAIVNPAVAPVVAYEPSKVPTGTSKPAEFVTLALVQRSGGTPRAGRYATTGWALYVMAASKVSENNARLRHDKIAGVLDGRILTIAGATSTPVTFDNARPVSPDDGYSTGVRVYHFAL